MTEQEDKFQTAVGVVVIAIAIWLVIAIFAKDDHPNTSGQEEYETCDIRRC